MNIVMNTQLSTPRPIKSKTYKQNIKVFFEPSKLFLAQITELYDDVWPTVTAIQYFREKVVDYCKTKNVKDNSALVEEFAKSKDKSNRPNLARFCILDTMEEIKLGIARNLLINLFAYYEAWEEEMLVVLKYSNKTKKSTIKPFQFPSNSKAKNYYKFLPSIQKHGCQDLIDAFYALYTNGNYSLLDNWLKYYRYFKELRNCIVHRGSQASIELMGAYNDIKTLIPKDLIVKELPTISVITVNDPISYTLRDVVWFSQILINLVITFDAELIKCDHADEYFCQEIANVYTKKKKLPNNDIDKTKLVRSLSGKAFFKKPTDEMKIYNLLIVNGVL